MNSEKEISREILLAEREILYALDRFRDDPSRDMAAFLEKSIRYIGVAMDLTHGAIAYNDPATGSMVMGACYNCDEGTTARLKAIAAKAMKSGKARKTAGSFLQPLVFDGAPFGCILVEKDRLDDKDSFLFHAAVSQIDSGLNGLIEYQTMCHKERIHSLLLEIDRIRDENHDDIDAFMQGAMKKITDYLSLSGAFASLLDHVEKVYYPVFEMKATTTDYRGPIEKVRKSRKALRNDSLFVFPLVLHDTLLSVMCIEKEPCITRWDEEIFLAACAQIDSSLEAIMNLIRYRQKSRVVDTLYAIDRIRDENSENFDRMLEEIGNQLSSIMDSKGGFIVLYEKEEPVLKCLTGFPCDMAPVIIDLARKTVRFKKVMSTKKPYPGIASSLSIPLILKEKIIGVCGVLNPLIHRFYNQYDAELLEAIGSQADTAIFESREKLKIRNVFKRYVSEDVINEMIEKEDDYLSGKRKYMTVLFADMRGFTSMSERLKDPELVVETIDRYLEAMTEEILRHRGTLDKFVGDEVMALFGTPLPMTDHALTAVYTAVSMQKAMEDLRKAWYGEERERCNIGIGINTGIMIAGNIGCEKMTDYTVLGPSVNLAARLCGAATGRQILVTRETRDCIERTRTERSLPFDFGFVPLAPVTLKGIEKPVDIFEITY